MTRILAVLSVARLAQSPAVYEERRTRVFMPIPSWWLFKMFSKLSVFRYLACLLLLGMLPLAGCGDPTGRGDHASAVVFLQGDAEVARYVYRGQTTGTGLSAGAGATATYRIRVLTADGRQLPLDGQEFSLQGLLVGNQAIATAGLSAVDDILITGLLPGTTTLELSLWHAGHEDFRVIGIPLAVHAP